MVQESTLHFEIARGRSNLVATADNLESSHFRCWDCRNRGQCRGSSNSSSHSECLVFVLHSLAGYGSDYPQCGRHLGCHLWNRIFRGAGGESDEIAGEFNSEESTSVEEQDSGTDNDIDLAAPPVREAAREWASLNSSLPLFFPSYIPANSADVEVTFDPGGGRHEIWIGDSWIEFLTVDNATASPMLGDLYAYGGANVDVVTMADGYSYYYRVVTFHPEGGMYTVEFMETSVDEDDYYYRLRGCVRIRSVPAYSCHTGSFGVSYFSCFALEPYATLGCILFEHGCQKTILEEEDGHYTA